MAKIMNKKYKFTGVALQHEGIILHRIQALRSFGDVKEGDFGGWIEKEENLSHDGNCWVYENAQAFGNARVSEDAQVFGHARVYGDAQVYGSAWVCEDAHVYGHAQVYGYALVYGSARVDGHALVCEYAHVYADARVFGNTRVCGDARVCTNKVSKSPADNLPEELNTLPEGVEEVVFKGVKYKKVTKWERV